jgi:hypothetical protein
MRNALSAALLASLYCSGIVLADKIHAAETTRRA